jgi:hypothetical protein
MYESYLMIVIIINEAGFVEDTNQTLNQWLAQEEREGHQWEVVSEKYQEGSGHSHKRIVKLKKV